MATEKTSTKYPALSYIKDVCEHMKSIGADRFKVGDIEVHFGIQTPASIDAPVPEMMDEIQRDAVLDDVKGKLQKIAKAQDADLFYST